MIKNIFLYQIIFLIDYHQLIKEIIHGILILLETKINIYYIKKI